MYTTEKAEKSVRNGMSDLSSKKRINEWPERQPGYIHHQVSVLMSSSSYMWWSLRLLACSVAKDHQGPASCSSLLPAFHGRLGPLII